MPMFGVVDQFEHCCALEQLLSDYALATGETSILCLAKASADAAVTAGRCLLAPDPIEQARLRAQATAIERQFESIRSSLHPGRVYNLQTIEGGLPLWPVVPDCAQSIATDWLRFTRWLDIELDRYISALQKEIQAVIVVGIRTGGSYLGPLVAATIEKRKLKVMYTTVRPIRGEWTGLKRITLPQDYTFIEIARVGSADLILVVDDLIGSGQTAGALRLAIQAQRPRNALVGAICLAEFQKDVVKHLLSEQGFDFALVGAAGEVGGDLWERRGQFDSMQRTTGSTSALVTEASSLSGKPRPFPLLWTDKSTTATKVVRYVGSSRLARTQARNDAKVSGLGIELVGDFAMEPYLPTPVKESDFSKTLNFDHLIQVITKRHNRAISFQVLPDDYWKAANMLLQRIAQASPSVNFEVLVRQVASLVPSTKLAMSYTAMPSNAACRHLRLLHGKHLVFVSALTLHGDCVGSPIELMAGLLCDFDLPTPALWSLIHQLGRIAELPCLVYAMLKHTARELNRDEYLLMIGDEERPPGWVNARKKREWLMARRASAISGRVQRVVELFQARHGMKGH